MTVYAVFGLTLVVIIVGVSVAGLVFLWDTRAAEHEQVLDRLWDDRDDQETAA